MAQVWHDLLFAHWPFDVEVVRRLVPASLPLDTWDGAAWIGVVPFRMSGVRLRLTPPLPGLSAFPELNVRTYVTLDGKPGVFFFSLDAASRIAVAGARRLFHLPYHHARMTARADGDAIAYDSSRITEGAVLRARYRPTGPASPAAAASLDDWLTARYCLYTLDGTGRVRRCEIDHPAWPLQPAEASLEANTMLAPLGLEPPRTPPLLHFSRRLAVRVWPLR